MLIFQVATKFNFGLTVNVLKPFCPTRDAGKPRNVPHMSEVLGSIGERARPDMHAKRTSVVS